MQAVVITSPGGPEVLELRTIPDPVPARGEVCVRVRATAVNRADLLQRMGMYPAPAGAPSDIPGLELAGEIDAVGEGVTEWSVGERVFGLAGGGAYAERIVLPARAVARMPAKLDFVHAAAIPEAFLTAYDAMVLQGGLAAGESVLVSAVGSGVGTAAVQIARAIGARPFGTARTQDKLDRAKALGMIGGVVPAAGGRFADAIAELTGGGGPDVVLELVGGAYVAEDIRCAHTRGRIVVVGLMAGAQAELDLRLLLFKRLVVHGTVLRARPLEEKIAAARVLETHLAPLFDEGKLAPVIDRVLPLAEVRRAHELMASNETFGKIVLEMPG
jgi:NADPH2:quinone reductase